MTYEAIAKRLGLIDLLKSFFYLPCFLGLLSIRWVEVQIRPWTNKLISCMCKKVFPGVKGQIVLSLFAPMKDNIFNFFLRFLPIPDALGFLTRLLNVNGNTGGLPIGLPLEELKKLIALGEKILGANPLKMLEGQMEQFTKISDHVISFVSKNSITAIVSQVEQLQTAVNTAQNFLGGDNVPIAKITKDLDSLKNLIGTSKQFMSENPIEAITKPVEQLNKVLADNHQFMGENSPVKKLTKELDALKLLIEGAKKFTDPTFKNTILGPLEELEKLMGKSKGLIDKLLPNINIPFAAPYSYPDGYFDGNSSGPNFTHPTAVSAPFSIPVPLQPTSAIGYNHQQNYSDIPPPTPYGLFGLGKSTSKAEKADLANLKTKAGELNKATEMAKSFLATNPVSALTNGFEIIEKTIGISEEFLKNNPIHLITSEMEQLENAVRLSKKFLDGKPLEIISKEIQQIEGALAKSTKFLDTDPIGLITRNLAQLESSVSFSKEFLEGNPVEDLTETFQTLKKTIDLSRKFLEQNPVDVIKEKMAELKKNLDGAKQFLDKQERATARCSTATPYQYMSPIYEPIRPIDHLERSLDASVDFFQEMRSKRKMN